MKLLFEASPAEGNGNLNEGGTQGSPPNPQAGGVPPSPTPVVNPPATERVINGKTEREVQLEQEARKLREENESLHGRARDLETTLSERERDIQNLKALPREQPKKEKRLRMFPTIIDSEPYDEGEGCS